MTQIKANSLVGNNKKDNPSDSNSRTRKPNPFGEQGSRGNEQQRQAPGQEQGNDPAKRHAPGEEQKDEGENEEARIKQQAPSSEGAIHFM